MTEGPTQLTAMLLGHGTVVTFIIRDQGHALMSVNMSDKDFVKAVRSLVAQAQALPTSPIHQVTVSGTGEG